MGRNVQEKVALRKPPSTTNIQLMKRFTLFLFVLPILILGFAGCASSFDANTGGDVPGAGKSDSAVSPAAAPNGAGANVKF